MSFYIFQTAAEICEALISPGVGKLLMLALDM